MESEILKFICANQGSVAADDLVSNLGCSVSDIISNRDKLVLCCPFGQPKVVARTTLRLCRAKDCQGSCRGLHVCRKFLLSGSCQFTKTRKGCIFSHDLNSDHNKRLLKEHELDNLNKTELCTLLLQSDCLLPQICYDYNNGDGEFGRCQDGYSCTRLHICEKYMNRDCSCSRNHDFSAPQALKVLPSVPEEIILKSVYGNIQALKYHDQQDKKFKKGNQQMQSNRGKRGGRGNSVSHQQRPALTTSSSSAANDLTEPKEGNSCKQQQSELQQTSAAIRGGNGNCVNGVRQQLQGAKESSTADRTTSDDMSNSKEMQKPMRDKTEICMYFIKGHCRHEMRCYDAHENMPYMWQARVNDQWTAMPNNEAVEKDYCDPIKTYSTCSPPVYFETMTCGQNKVRRLSTANSLLKPDFNLTTEWLWYWEDEVGKWNIYASGESGHNAADMDSSTLEQRFLKNAKDVVEFKAGSQTYSLGFEDMIQTNKRYGTKRLVRRRPKFVSAPDVQAKRLRKPLGQMCTVPNHWDKTQIPQTGFKRVALDRSSTEFKEVETLFCKTMNGFEIVKIERIQNKALWDVFQLQKTQMKNNNGGRNVTERKLFHGTDNEYLDTICHTNFDWRLCGSHGTAYGKGSYFAQNAKYSHSYTGDSDVKSMFVVRLLVGEYTKGSPEYRRPPSKDGGNINFFDSCVDNVQNPSIYVVFQQSQIYPEYLLQYRDYNVSLFGSAYTQMWSQPSKPSSQPSTSPYQPSISSYRPSTSSYRPSTSSYRSSTSSYQPSTSSYQPSTSSYQPSTSSYQTSTSSYQTSTSSHQPSTSSYQTSTSSYQTSTSSYQPSTSSYQTSTSSYQTSTSSHQPSTSSHQPAKKPEKSCVIS